MELFLLFQNFYRCFIIFCGIFEFGDGVGFVDGDFGEFFFYFELFKYLQVFVVQGKLFVIFVIYCDFGNVINYIWIIYILFQSFIYSVEVGFKMIFDSGLREKYFIWFQFQYDQGFYFLCLFVCGIFNLVIILYGKIMFIFR